jgi:Na+-translocating ferredoxin:NAD+ oxidoreductase subunit G
VLNLKMIKPAIILCIIGLFTTGLLSFTYELTREQRDYQEKAAANANRLALYPDAADFSLIEPESEDSWPDGIQEVNRAQDADGDLMGYLIVSSRKGYGGIVPVMVAIDPSGIIVGVRVLFNDETPGLGKNIEKPGFLGQFIDHPADTPFSIDGDSTSTIDAVSGATISSRAVTDAINKAIDCFQTLKEDQ